MLDKNNWNIVRAVIGMRKKEELAFVCDNQKWYNTLLIKSLKIVQETEVGQKYHMQAQTKREICEREEKKKKRPRAVGRGNRVAVLKNTA